MIEQDLGSETQESRAVLPRAGHAMYHFLPGCLSCCYLHHHTLARPGGMRGQCQAVSVRQEGPGPDIIIINIRNSFDKTYPALPTLLASAQMANAELVRSLIDWMFVFYQFLLTCII